MAKRFFYVCVGLLALSLSFAAGAQVVRGQGGGNPDCVAVDPEYGSVAVFGRTMVVRPMGGPYGVPETIPLPVPGSAAVIACAPYAVLLEDGETYLYQNPQDGWLHVGNVFGNPTPTIRSSWGAVKHRYR